MLVPISGFGPDLDPTTPGVITSAVNMIPTIRGYKAAPSEVSTSLPALAAECRGSAVCVLLNNTTRLFAGTATKLYESGGSSWTDVTRAVGGNYSLGADSRWRFAQFGDVSLAACGASDSLQYSNGSGAFANVTGTPKGEVITTVGSFVMLGAYNDGSDVPNGLWWCALGDYTSWTPNIATQAGKTNITSSPGKITALHRLGTQVVAYKKDSMHLGTYQGSPLLWTFSEISSTAGAPCQEAVVPIVTPELGFAHVWMGSDDFFLFNGGQPIRIGSPVREYVFGRLNKSYAYRTVTVQDPVNGLIYWFYPSTSSVTGNPDSAIVYNYKSNKWGVMTIDLEAGVAYVSGGYTYTSFDAAYSTYNGTPTVSYDSPFFTASSSSPSIFNTSHLLKTLTGTPGTCSATFGDAGMDGRISTINRVRPRWITRPSSATLTHYYKMENGDSLTTGVNTNMSTGHFDVVWDARWHRVKIEHSGSTEYSHLDYELEPSSYE